MSDADLTWQGTADELIAEIVSADTAQPFVVAQLGQSLDGRIATQTGDSRWINGSAALDHLHKLRAAVDAVVVGVGTVIADDPQLTVRRVRGESPVRVIIDPSGRAPAAARMFHDDGPACVLVRAANHDATHREPAPMGCETMPMPSRDGRLDPESVVKALFKRGLRRLLIEGGATTISRFVDAGAVDRLHLLVGPMILGSGTPGLTLRPIARIAEAITPSVRAVPLPGGDVLFDCQMKPRAGETNTAAHQRS